jgi:predicted nucleic acid-binding protein
VIALARGDKRARAFLTRARDLRARVEVPVVVVAETVRGDARDAPVNRILKAVGESPVATEAMGRTAGGLLGAAASAATVDALVVAQAIHGGGAVIVTSDPDDLGRLAAHHPEVVVHATAKLG